jgi:hypothetical protein
MSNGRSEHTDPAAFLREWHQKRRSTDEHSDYKGDQSTFLEKAKAWWDENSQSRADFQHTSALRKQHEEDVARIQSGKDIGEASTEAAALEGLALRKEEGTLTPQEEYEGITGYTQSRSEYLSKAGEQKIVDSVFNEAIAKGWKPEKTRSVLRVALEEFRRKDVDPTAQQGSSNLGGLPGVEENLVAAGGGAGASYADKLIGLHDKIIGLAGRRPDRRALEAAQAQLEAGKREEHEKRMSMLGLEEQHQEDQLRQARREIETQQLLDKNKSASTQKARTAINAAYQDLRNNKIEPHRIYKNLFTGVAAAVATAIGAYAEGISGGKVPNTALLMITKAEEMDLQAQREEYKNAKDKANLAQNLYAQLMQEWNDEEMAVAKYHAITREWLGWRYKVGMTQAKSELEKTVFDKLLKENEVQRELDFLKVEAQYEANGLHALTQLMTNAREMAKFEATTTGAGGRVVKGSLADIANKASILNSQLDVLDEFVGSDGIGNMLQAAGLATDLLGTTVGGGLTALFEKIGLLSDEDRGKIAKVIPSMGSILYQVIRINDPTGIVSDKDQKFFESKAITWWDMGHRESFDAKVRAYRELARIVQGLSSQGVNIRDAYSVRDPNTGKLVAVDNPLQRIVQDGVLTNPLLAPLAEGWNADQAKSGPVNLGY